MCRLLLSALILGYLNYVPVNCQESPCPGTFEYRSDGFGVHGLIHLQPNGPVSSIQMTANFTIAARLSSNYAGRLEPVNPSVLTTRPDSPIDYRVHFPVTSPLPRLTALIVNNNVICYGSGDVPQPNLYVTTISLQHKLPVRGGQPGFNQGGFNQPSFNQPSFNQPDPDQYQPPRPRPQEPSYNSIGSSPNTQVFPFNVDDDRTGSLNLVPPFERPQQQKPRPPPPPPQPDYFEYTTSTRRPAPPPPRPETIYPSMPSRLPAAASSECGVVSGGNEHVPLIYQGQGYTPYTRGEWPWLVAIYKRKDGSLTFVCSGTLVSDRHVVTAAHCLKQGSVFTSIWDIVIKVGVHNLKDWGDDITVTRTLVSAAIHESYNSSTYSNDLLVVTFDRSVEFNVNIRPACLWTRNNDQRRIVGASGVVAGWGGSNSEPRMVRLPVVSTGTCRASKPDFHVLTSSSTLCAGDRNGTGPCLGDSGGGMYLLEGGRWRLRGVVSLSLRADDAGTTCDLNEYFIFTDAAKYVQWIKNAMEDTDIRVTAPIMDSLSRLVMMG